MGFKYWWISATELQSWTTICCRRQEGPWNGCVSQAWFMIGCSLKPSPFRAWVLFDFSGLCLLREWKKERKNTAKEMGSERKWRKERKKNCSETEREETFTTWRPSSTLAETRLSETSSTLAETSSLTQQLLKSNVVLTWIRGKKRATQLSFFFLFSFFFRKSLHSTVITFFLDSWLLFFWLNWLFGFLLQTII